MASFSFLLLVLYWDSCTE